MKLVGVLEEERTKLRTNYAKKMALHNPWSRKLGIHAVRNEHGIPIYGEDDAAAHLSEHWGKQFEEKPIDSKLGHAFT